MKMQKLLLAGYVSLLTLVNTFQLTIEMQNYNGWNLPFSKDFNLKPASSKIQLGEDTSFRNPYYDIDFPNGKY